MDASRSDRPYGPWLNGTQALLSAVRLSWSRWELLTALPVAYGSMVCVVSNPILTLHSPGLQSWKVWKVDTPVGRSRPRTVSRLPGIAYRTRLFKYYGPLIVVAPIAMDSPVCQGFVPATRAALWGSQCGRCLRYGVSVAAL
jgi:hypothetical protein